MAEKKISVDRTKFAKKDEEKQKAEPELCEVLMRFRLPSGMKRVGDKIDPVAEGVSLARYDLMVKRKAITSHAGIRTKLEKAWANKEPEPVEDKTTTYTTDVIEGK